MTADPDDDVQQELAVAATLPAPAPAPAPAIGESTLPAPSILDAANDAERDRERGRSPRFHLPGETHQLGRYVVLGRLGRGAMGTVLEAFDRTLDRRVALKVLHHELAERHRARLLREAQALAKLSHPNVVQVYEAGEAEGQVFIAMELVRGPSLWDWVKQDERPGWEECVKVYVQAGEGLAAAHAEGLVHRDFKPSNAVIDDKGRVRVLDFGLVRQAEDVPQSDCATPEAEPSSEDPTLTPPLTRTGTVLGTPAYMPLEQMAGQPTDARSDQFSYCVSLYEALYGERPFEGNSMEALVLALEVGKARPAPRGARVPEALRRLVLRGLAPLPSDRWPSMEALLGELRRLVAPRRRAWQALAMAGGLAAVGIGFAQYAEVGFRCEGARAQLDGVWDDPRKQEVKGAILGTGLSYAPDTWVRVEQQLDEYAQAWARKHTEVCEATSVQQEQSAEVMDLRMGCLRERRVALREVVAVLSGADATQAVKALELVASLPGLVRCDDVEALRAAFPPPEDPQVAAEVEALRERLAHARSLRAAGAYAEGLTEAEEAVAEAEQVSFGPVLAEVLLERSRERVLAARFTEAEEDAERAYRLAAQHEHDDVEAAAVGHLVYLVGHHLAEHEAALQWGKTALAAASRPGVAPELEATSRSNIGAVLWDQGKLDEALTQHQRALAIREQALGPRHISVANSLSNIGLVLMRQGKLEESLVHQRRALGITQEALGPRHPHVADALNYIGITLGQQGKLEEALPHLQRGLTIHEEAFGPRHPNVANTLGNISTALLEQGKLEEALALQQRALSIREQALGPRHPDVANSLNNIGTIVEIQAKLDEALDHYQRALAIREGAFGLRHPALAYPLRSIGTVLSSQGKQEEALIHLQRALAISEEALGPRHVDVASSLRAIGLAFQRQGTLPEAKRHYERALAISEEVVGPTHRDVAYALVGLAQIGLEAHDDGAALQHAERAVSIREAAEVTPADLAEARFVLARALWPDRSRRDSARTLAARARDAYAELGAPKQQELAAVEQWLAEHGLQ